MLSRLFAAALALGLLTVSAVADDWVATKLRGQVLQLVDGDWQPLARGDVVPDDRVIRTLAGGRVEFQRDAETIALGPQTQIQILDKSGKRFTTVKQYFGEVAVEAEVQNVQHFAVETPFLAAVVKGTRFTVTSGKNTASVVVQRGRVWVESEASKSTTTIAAGQSASTGPSGDIKVKGKGKLPPVISATGVVLSLNGKPVDSKTLQETAKATGQIVSGTLGTVGNTATTVVDTVTGTTGTVVETVTSTVTNTTTTVTNTVTTTTGVVNGLLNGGGKKKGLLGGLL